MTGYHHGDLRNALIDAAVATIESEGIGAVTMRGLAKSVDVSRSAPYRHFSGLEDILAAVGDQGFGQLTRLMQAALIDLDAPQEQVIALGCAYVRFAVANPIHFRVMFGDGIDNDELRGRVLSSGLQSFQMLLEAVRRLQAAGEVHSGHIMDVALPAWSMIHGFASLVSNQMIPLGKQPDQEIEAHVRRISELFLRGARP